MRPMWRVLCGALTAFVATVPDVGRVEALGAAVVLLGLCLALRRRSGLVIAGALLGVVGAWRVEAALDRAALWSDLETTCMVHFLERRDARSWDVELAHTGAPRVPARLTRAPDAARPGEVWRLAVRTSPAPRVRNPDDRRALRARLASGAVVRARVLDDAVERVDEGPGPAWAHRARDAVVARWDETLGGSAGLWRALLLADRRALHDAATRRVQELGFAHLLALSGLHVGVVVALLARGLAACGRHALLLSVPLLVVWTLVAGAGPSMVRAVVMVALIAIGRGLRRGVLLEDVLAACACLEIAVRPEVLGGIGWWLSYAATLSIVRALPWLDGRSRVVQGLAISFVAQAGTLPWILDAFGRLPLLSPFVLLIVGPAFTAVLTLGGAAAVLAAWGVPGAAGIAAGLAHGFGGLLHLAAPTGRLVLHHPGIGDEAWLVATGLLALGLVPVRGVQPRHVGAAIVVVLLLVHAPSLLPGGSARHEWVSFDVGQGDGGVYRCGDRTLVVDTGPGHGDWQPVERSILPFVVRRDLRDVEIVLTHRHLDHVAGTRHLLRTGRVAVLHMAALERDEDWARTFAAEAGSLGVRVGWIAAGDRLWEECCRPEVLWPPARPIPPGAVHDANDRSVVLVLGPAEARLLATGDLERAGEAEVLGRLRPGPEAWILKVAHHGGDTGTDDALLARLQPGWSILSCGHGNRYGHPRPEVVERLQAHGSRVLRTDRHGAVTVRWGASGPRVRTAGGGP